MKEIKICSQERLKSNKLKHLFFPLFLTYPTSASCASILMVFPASPGLMKVTVDTTRLLYDVVHLGFYKRLEVAFISQTDIRSHTVWTAVPF